MPTRLQRLISASCLAGLLIVSPLQSQQNSAAPPSDAQVQAFVSALMAKMTVDEKIGQMEQAAGQYTAAADADALAREGKVGSFLFITDPVRINQLQHIAVEQSRLHIPLIFGYDVIHGFRTIFPIPLALASSWDPAIAEEAQSMAAREARAAGVEWAFGPMVDIARDARWGRIMEGAGEDPYLGEQMAAAQVRGFQGPFIGSPDHILASTKHFAGYGAAVGGRDYDSSDISDEQLHNVFLRPYKAAVDAGTATIMSAYMDLNGVPATGNTWLMQDTLRSAWRFKGFVVSDWNAVKNLQTHGFAADPEDAAVRSLRAGINMEMTSSVYRDNLPTALKEGKVSIAQIDDLVRPILEMKYRLGLFTHPYVDLDHYKQITGDKIERAAALHAAEETPVLLRNEDHALPLSKSLHSIALIGPLADSPLDTNGSWAIHGDRAETISIAQGLREKLPNTKISVTTGVEIQRANKSIFDDQTNPPTPKMTTEAERTTEFKHALDLARAADTAVLVLGENQNMNGENASRAELTLPGQQQRLLEAVVALGKPVVLVVMTGRPLDITWAATHVPAILNAWYPGSEGGRAVANLLTGDKNPSGHLTVSWPRSVGQLPLYYNTNLTMSPQDAATRYWDEPSSPLYPFGYGLSYSSFAISGLKLTSNKVSTSGSIQASVVVSNTSDVAGEEVLQLYTHQLAGSASRPVRELKAFRKLALKPHETQTITLTFPASSLTYWSPVSHQTVLEPGTFDLWLGDSSAAPLHSTFTLQ